MKSEKLLNTLKILFFITLALLLVFAITHPKKTQTNILKAILSNSEQDELLINLSQKHSGKFNVIFESSQKESIEAAQKKFEEELSKYNFKTDMTKVPDFREALNTYKYYSANLLSFKTAREIKHHDYELVKLEALERLYNPMSINLLPIEEDPFMFFSDYLQSLGDSQNSGITERDGKFYSILNYSLADETALSPSLLNKEIAKVIKNKNNIEKEFKDINKDVKIYLSGSPIHTYYASSKSMKEINIICLLSSLFIVFLCKFYFKTFKILAPISTSLFIGILTGYLLTSLFFDSIHILTFVFSTTLIGICVDYSLHFFAHDNNLGSIFKSLTISMLTTISAFLILLFSHIRLLQQIAVFTAGGLISVYLFVVLFYPFICKKFFCEMPDRMDISEIFDFELSTKAKGIILGLCILLSVAGIAQIKFNDEVKDMYNPPKYLVSSEKLNANLSGQSLNTTFLLIKGKDLQSILENEEKATEAISVQNFTALSKFVPSIERQKENRILKETFYKKELNSYADFLNQDSKNKLLKQHPRLGFLTLEKLPLPMLQNFFVTENSTVIILKDAEPKLIEKVLADNPDVSYIDLKNDISSKVELCRKACLALILPIVILLFVFLSFIYNPKNALKIILPSLLGGMFSIGMLGLFHQHVNLFHILALFLIAGFSLDYSVFRFNGAKNLAASNAAVLISCATSAFSFLLLSMTSFKLISSLGFVLAFGLVSSYIFSLLLISPCEDNDTDNI